MAENIPETTIEVDPNADVIFTAEVFVYNSATGGSFVKLPNAPISYNIKMEYLKPTWTFDFTFSAQDEETYSDLVLLTNPFTRIQIFINNIGIFNGIIWKQVLGGKSPKIIQFSGTDYRALLIDAHIDTSIKLKKGMDLSDAFAKVCEPLGIFNVDYGQGWVDYLTSVINTQAKAEEKPITIEDEKPSPNEGIQEFLTKLCKKYGKTILPGIDTNSISITSPNYSAEPTIPINLRLYELEDGANNNILDLQVTRDYKDVPTYAISYGSVQDTKKILQLKKAIKVTDPVDKLLAEAKATKAGTKQASTQVYPFDGLQKDVLFMRTNIVEERVIPGTRAGQAKAELAKIYRPLIISDKTAKNQKQLNNRLNRAVADRFKDAFIVEAVVKGHGPERAFIYFPDIIVNVDDRVHGVFEKMWVSGVELSASEGNSPKTKLTLYRNKSIILGED